MFHMIVGTYKDRNREGKNAPLGKLQISYLGLVMARYENAARESAETEVKVRR